MTWRRGEHLLQQLPHFRAVLPQTVRDVHLGGLVARKRSDQASQRTAKLKSLPLITVQEVTGLLPAAEVQVARPMLVP
jgi:hypothetical protein